MKHLMVVNRAALSRLTLIQCASDDVFCSALYRDHFVIVKRKQWYFKLKKSKR